ncbi:MAG: hypothetical protein WCF18_23855 [Chthoniobacteraceae bacterium]
MAAIVFGHIHGTFGGSDAFLGQVGGGRGHRRWLSGGPQAACFPTAVVF